jgi:hypothetical protein
VSFERARWMFELDGIVHFLLGVLLLLGSWNGLYHALQLPRLNPALFAQLGGAAFLGLATLLWLTPSIPELARAVAAGAAVANGLGGLVILAWLVGRWNNLTNYWHVGGLGKLILAAIGLTLLALALGESMAFRRGIAPPQKMRVDEGEPVAP